MKFSYLSFFLLILLPVLFFFLTRGVITHDEGYILYSSEKLLNGLLPYRDFNFVYTPLSLYLTALTFKILGVSILSSRILILILSLTTCILLYKIIILATKNKMYATLSVLIFVAWGPLHINFVWPVMFAITFAFLACFLLLKFLETRLRRYLYLAGSTVFLVFLCKQNFGIAMLLPVFVFFLTKSSRKINFILDFIFGYTWSFLIFAIYLLQTGSFAPFAHDFYLFTVQRIVIDARLTTNFIYHDSLFNMIFRTSFYLIPAIASISCLILLFIRRRFHLLFLPFFVLSFYMVGIRPTTDYTHLVPLLALIGIPVALYLRYNISSALRMLLFALTFIFIILGFWTALFKGYYRWDAPLITHNFFFSNERVNIFLNEKFYNEFKDFIAITNTYTSPDEYILVNSYNPLLYFILQRREPVKNNYLTTDVDPKKYYEEVLGNLVGKEINMLILDHNSINSLPIQTYVRNHYSLKKTIYDFDVYIRNP